MAESKKATVVVPETPIDGQVIDDFRRILGLGTEAPVPEKVLRLYRSYKKRVDVCSAGTVTPKEMILLVLLAEEACQKVAAPAASVAPSVPPAPPTPAAPADPKAPTVTFKYAGGSERKA